MRILQNCNIARYNLLSVANIVKKTKELLKNKRYHLPHHSEGIPLSEP